MLTWLLTLIACIGAVLGGLLGLTYRPSSADPAWFQQAIPIASGVSGVAGFVGLITLLIPKPLGHMLIWVGIRLSPGVVPPDPTPEQIRTLRLHVDTLLTWVYRRRHWPTLSSQGRSTEGAPENYGQEVYDLLGLDGRYRRPGQAIAEPDYDGHDFARLADVERQRNELLATAVRRQHVPGPTHGTSLDCPCGWKGEGAPAASAHVEDAIEAAIAQSSST